jgi:hypothetical protein
MTNFTPPIYIDFITTYQNKNKITGYWFMTFIKSPRYCQIWYKASNGKWFLTTDEEREGDEFIHYYPGDTVYSNSKVQASPERQAFMDEFLDKHLKTRNYRDKPWIYWKDS